MVNLHTHQQNNPKHIEIVNVYPWEYHENGDFLSIGIHPWYVNEDRLSQDLEIIVNHCNQPKFIAIGECGLDKRIDIPLKFQTEVFFKQLALAQTFHKPVIIHCVNAYQEVIKIKNESKLTVPMIIHGYSKSLQLAQDLIGKGFYLSFGKYLILNEDLAEVLKNIPLDQCFFETDNSQFSLNEIYEKASRVLQMKKNKLIDMQSGNFDKVFLQNKRKI